MIGREPSGKAVGVPNLSMELEVAFLLSTGRISVKLSLRIRRSIRCHVPEVSLII